MSSVELLGQQADSLRIESHYYYLADLDPKTIAKKFLSDELSPSDNFITFRVLDSLSSSNKKTRKFYLPVFNKILKQSDGALAEVVGSYVIDYLEQYPTEFTKTIESDKLFELYSNFAAAELYFSNDYKIEIEKLEALVLDKRRPYTNTEIIKNFLKLTIKKIEEI